MTWVIEPHVSLVPSMAVWDAASLDLQEAWGRFSEVVAPAKVTRGFLLGAVLGSWISSFVADLFAFRARTRLEAVVPSFTVFLFGALLGSDRHRLSAALLFLAAVLTFVVLAEVFAAPRPRPWLSGRRAAGERALVRSGLGMAGVAVIIAVLVGPQLPGAYAKGILGVGDNGGRKNGTRVTLSPLVDIRGRLVSQSSVELFTVATDTPTYWRITSLDRFDGNIWSSLSNYRPAGTRLPALGPDASRGGERPVHPGVRDLRAWRRSGCRRRSGPSGSTPRARSASTPTPASLATDKETSDGMKYTVESALPRLTATDLTAVGAEVPPDIAARYLELPASVSRQVQREARRVVGNEQSPYKRAKALQDYFRDNFTYNIQVSPGHDANAMDQFLASKQGYCEQFAGTYAAMARSLGLPARVAVGFTAGTQDADGRWHVTGKEAHAWPEVYLSGYGWVAFEPTPGRGLPGAEDYTNVAPAQAADTTTVVTTPSATASGRAARAGAGGRQRRRPPARGAVVQRRPADRRRRAAGPRPALRGRRAPGQAPAPAPAPGGGRHAGRPGAGGLGGGHRGHGRRRLRAPPRRDRRRVRPPRPQGRRPGRRPPHPPGRRHHGGGLVRRRRGPRGRHPGRGRGRGSGDGAKGPGHEKGARQEGAGPQAAVQQAASERTDRDRARRLKPAGRGAAAGGPAGCWPEERRGRAGSAGRPSALLGRNLWFRLTTPRA